VASIAGTLRIAPSSTSARPWRNSATTGTPVVALLRHGRALVLDGAIRNAPAILATWFLGEATGDAVGDVIFGIEGPSGHLPVSFPFASGQQPWSYDHRATGRPATDADPVEGGRARWRDAPDRALYSFGHGLTYSRLTLEDVALPKTMAWDGELAIEGNVRNGGDRDAVALVQLYIHDRVASRTRPVQQLKRFVRVDVGAGDRRKFTMNLARVDLAFVAQDGTVRAEPGDFDVRIALNGPSGGTRLSFNLAPRIPKS
ncbi:MAG: hypothetical protein EOP67_52165, partial [Sphingomonas sp.]